MNDVFTWSVGRPLQRAPAPLGPVLAYVVSSTAGGGALGAALGGFGWLLGLAVPSRAWMLIALLPVALLAAALQRAGVVAPLPERRRQVPTQWLLWRHPSSTALAFGAMIGAGVFTKLRHAVAWTLAILAVAAPSPTVAAAIGLVYGFCRGCPLVVTWVQDRRHHERWDWLRWTGPRSRIGRALAPLSLAAYVFVFLALPT